METVQLEPGRPCRVIGGLIPEACGAVVEQLAFEHAPGISVLLLPDLRQAERVAADLQLFSDVFAKRPLPAESVILPRAPAWEEEEMSAANEERELDRSAAFTRLRERVRTQADHPLLVITDIPTLFGPAPDPASLDDRSLVITVGESIGYEALRQRLEDELGYDAEAVCEYPGQYALRGGLLDVYPPNAEAPVRIDFFGDEIDGMRRFDPTNQRSEDAVERLVLAPRHRATDEAGGARGTVISYFESAVQWLWWEGADQAAEHREYFQQFERMADKRIHLGSVFRRPTGNADRFVALGGLPVAPPFFPADCPLEDWSLATHTAARNTVGVGLNRVSEEHAAREAFLHDLHKRGAAGEAVVVVVHNEGEAERIRTLIREESGDDDFRFSVSIGDLERGFHLPAEAIRHFSWTPRKARGLNLVSENDLLGRVSGGPRRGPRRRLPQRSQVDHLLDFSELVEGDPLVHLAHGVCIFRGLAKMDLGGRDDEVISLEFADSITLHLPLHESHLLTRYVGLTKVPPKLGRLGTNQWERSRREAEKATLDFAAEMLRLQAVREEGEGHPFAPDSDWQRMFEAAFPFEETPDQKSAIEATKADMMRRRPMDRLICGDVGFGKTEVAIRAAFKAVMDSKQVAILVPTTVLAQQHFNTFRDRMAEYPVTVEMISRFRTPEQQKEILAQTTRGEVDILIGTHRLLSSDVRFADLGLLVIDEEHRFGVRHKERLKHLRTHVDVLTMSATPIPRTLYLALMGARDLSTIETAPTNRRPIETVVRAYDPQLVQKAIRFELERGGQVFYLHNRVQTIEAVAGQLRDWLPKARIGVGHGQMNETELEKIMTQFVAGEHDVLVCTTIIENGLDIPNCNTMIIEGADRFGLAQLYQLRGRVGRFNRQAYAYLLLHRHGQVLKVARERLSAMRQHNQLGAGFKIAMRDLELRGAGNLLGAQQSGHIASVGFELYCQLLRQSVARLKGEDAADHIRATVKLDFVTLGESDETGRPGDRSVDVGFGALKAAEIEGGLINPVSAFLPVAYIAETRLRIDFYRRLALAARTSEVDQIRADLVDRFGKLPPPAEVLVRTTRLRTLAQECRFIHVATEGNRLKIRRASKNHDDFVKIAARFPRLTKKTALPRLREIEQFLLRHRPKALK